MKDLINRVQKQLDNNHAVEAEDIQALLDYASGKRKLKTTKKDMPIRMVMREDYEEIISVLNEVHGIFSIMGYNPDATVINRTHKDIKRILSRHE